MSEQPSVAALHLSKAELIDFADKMRDKAQTEHQQARHWRQRAAAAEQRLALYQAKEQGTTT